MLYICYKVFVKQVALNMNHPENNQPEDGDYDSCQTDLPITESGDIDWEEIWLREEDAAFPESSSKFFGRVLAGLEDEAVAEEDADETASEADPAEPGISAGNQDLT